MENLIELINDEMKVMENYADLNGNFEDSEVNKPSYECVVETYSQIESYLDYLINFGKEHGMSNVGLKPLFAKYENLRLVCEQSRMKELRLIMF